MLKKCSYRWKITVGTVLIIIVILCGGIYLREVTEKVTRQNEMHVEEVTVQISENIGNKIQSYIHNLKLIGNGLLVKQHVSRDELSKVLKYEIDSDLFSEIIVVGLDGRGIDSNNNNIHIEDRKYFKQAKIGEVYISDPIDSDIYNENVIVYSVPLIKDEEIVGAICGINNSELVKNQLKASVYDNKGCYYISNKEGKIILENHIDTENKVYDKQGEISHNTKAFIQSKATDKDIMDNGSDVDVIKGIKKYIAYSKIDSTKDWYIITTVPMLNVFIDAQEVIYITVGVLCLFILCAIIINLYIIKTNRNNNQKLEKAVYEDHLTEINNYEKFIIDGDKFLNLNRGQCALILFDIEKFKVINDIYGYKEGDNVLKGISRNLQRIFNNNAIYGRLTGDTFALLIDIDNSDEDLSRICHIIKEKIANTQSMENINNKIKINLSMGVYIIEANRKRESKSIQNLIDYADMAKLKSKSMKHVEYLIFDEEMRAEKKLNLQLEHDLQYAIENNEFSVFYQPKYDIITGKVIGAEALLRWNHPIMGFVGPDKFIPIAEKNGYINKIGKWVFNEVCKTLMIWSKESIQVVPISVNLSRVELYQDDLITFLEDTMNNYNIPAQLVEMEITETTTLNDLSFIKDKIEQIKMLGIKVLMDDFGVGNSNISNLKDIPIDILKIDRSILIDIETNIKSKVVVESILNICKHLGLDVVGEGVENMNQVEILKTMGCRVIQGYVFYKPLNKSKYKLLLENS